MKYVEPKTSTSVFCTFSVEGFHSWNEAGEIAGPDAVFLQSYHRHLFNFRIEVPVSHNDRDVEFILFKSV